MIETYRKILSMLTPRERKRFFILLAFVLLMSLFEVLSTLSIVPFLALIANPSMVETNRAFSTIYQMGNFTNNQEFFVFVGICVFVITIFGICIRASTSWVLMRFSLMRSYNLSLRLLSGYLHQPYVWFLSRHSSELGQGVLSEVQKFVQGNLLPALRLIADSMIIVLIVGLIFTFEPAIAIGAVILLGGVYTCIYLVVRNRLVVIGAERMAANKARFHAVNEATGGVKELKLMGLEDRFLTSFRGAAFKMAAMQFKTMLLTTMPRFALEALAFGGLILLILSLIVRGDGDLSTLLPTLGLLAMATTRILPAIQNIYRGISALRVGKANLERLHNDLKELDGPGKEARRQADTLPKKPLEGTLELDNIHFAYPSTDQSALRGMSLAIRANTTVGIVGGTGAGKTTLVDIILGLLTPTDGRLLVDGDEVTKKNIRAWQKSLGYVPQSIFLTDDTMAANIAFGVKAEEIDHAAVEAAARAASLHNFIMSEMPEGYATKVGERGTRLSGGQRQRVGIARALYHNPDVMIMDEATSALDVLTEQAVMEAVHNISGTKTIIMIAHRLSTVRNCDEIFLLRDGKVAARGTYEELIEKDDEFRQMTATA